MKAWFKKLVGLLTGKVAKQSAYRDHVARMAPGDVLKAGASWQNETILILGQDDRLHELAKELSACGASVSFQFLARLQDLYHLPIEHYSMVIMTSGSGDQQFDVIDVGGILRRANSDIILIWASEEFKISMVADAITDRFCDFQLALPASPAHLEALLHESPRRAPLPFRAASLQ